MADFSSIFSSFQSIFGIATKRKIKIFIVKNVDETEKIDEIDETDEKIDETDEKMDEIDEIDEKIDENDERRRPLEKWT